MAVGNAPDLVAAFRYRRAQAQHSDDPYAAIDVARDTMIFWLAQAAKQARESAGRKQVHVAAAMDKNQSTVYRFEQGFSWPRDTDLFVAAYAEDLDLGPFEIWESALRLWREQGEAPRVRDLLRRRADPTGHGGDSLLKPSAADRAAQATGQQIAEAAAASRRARPASEEPSPASESSQEAGGGGAR